MLVILISCRDDEEIYPLWLKSSNLHVLVMPSGRKKLFWKYCRDWRSCPDGLLLYFKPHPWFFSSYLPYVKMYCWSYARHCFSAAAASLLHMQQYVSSPWAMGQSHTTAFLDLLTKGHKAQSTNVCIFGCSGHAF